MNLKSSLLELCQIEIENRIRELSEVRRSIIESKNNETKSSVGDKYETGRAMMQMEEQRISRQLSEILEMKITLTHIDPERSSRKIELGSIVSAGGRNYFISVALGKMKLGEDEYYCISVHSPVGQVLLGKETGSEFVFNEIAVKIRECY